MEPFGFLALLGSTGALAIFSDDDDAGTGNGDDPVEGTEFDISESGSFSGTEGNNTVTISGDVPGVSLDTGAGDDTVVGIDSYITSDATDATISTGAGDG